MSDNSVIAQASQYQNLWGMQAEQAIIALLAMWGTLSALPLPVLTNLGGGQFSWTSTVTPTFWNVYYSADGGNTYQMFSNQLPGTPFNSNIGVSVGDKLYIVGVNASGTMLTQNSNVVTA